MRLHPPEFEADPKNPFANDRLSRQKQVEGFCNMLMGIEGHAAVLLDGSWGSGKTAFARMSAAYLRSREVAVVEFNAWQQAHTDSPLVDLVSAISTQVGGETKKRIVETATKIGARAATAAIKVLTSGVVDLNELPVDEDRGLSASWEETEEETQHFKEHLKEAASGAGGQIVVLIDELDRCRPTYALELLSDVKHLFDVDGVIVVLAINRIELVHSVQSIYGPGFSADRYLRRFADLHAQLLRPSEPDLTSFLNDLLKETELWAQAGRPARKMLWLISEAPGCGLRDIQQTAYHAAAVLASLNLERHPGISETYEQLYVALLVLRTIDQGAYQNLTTGQIDGYESIAAVRRALTPDGSSRPAVTNKDLRGLEKTLFTVASGVQHPAGHWDFPGCEESEFADRYHAAVDDDSGEPVEVYLLLKQWSELPWLNNEAVRDITDLIDMMAPR